MKEYNKNFFFCYSKNLFHFLKKNGIRYICCGLNENTLNKFWLYQITDEFNFIAQKYTLEQKGS